MEESTQEGTPRPSLARHAAGSGTQGLASEPSRPPNGLSGGSGLQWRRTRARGRSGGVAARARNRQVHVYAYLR